MMTRSALSSIGFREFYCSNVSAHVDIAFKEAICSRAAWVSQTMSRLCLCVVAVRFLNQEGIVCVSLLLVLGVEGIPVGAQNHLSNPHPGMLINTQLILIRWWRDLDARKQVCITEMA